MEADTNISGLRRSSRVTQRPKRLRDDYDVDQGDADQARIESENEEYKHKPRKKAPKKKQGDDALGPQEQIKHSPDVFPERITPVVESCMDAIPPEPNALRPIDFHSKLLQHIVQNLPAGQMPPCTKDTQPAEWAAKLAEEIARDSLIQKEEHIKRRDEYRKNQDTPPPSSSPTTALDKWATTRGDQGIDGLLKIIKEELEDNNGSNVPALVRIGLRCNDELNLHIPSFDPYPVALLMTIIRYLPGYAEGTARLLLIVILCPVSDDMTIAIIIKFLQQHLKEHAAQQLQDFQTNGDTNQLSATIANLIKLLELAQCKIGGGNLWATDLNPLACSCYPADHCYAPQTATGKMAASAILQATCHFINSCGARIEFLACGNDAATELTGAAISCGPHTAPDFTLCDTYSAFAPTVVFNAIRHPSLLGGYLHSPAELDRTASQLWEVLERTRQAGPDNHSHLQELLEDVAWRVESAFRGQSDWIRQLLNEADKLNGDSPFRALKDRVRRTEVWENANKALAEQQLAPVESRTAGTSRGPRIEVKAVKHTLEKIVKEGQGKLVTTTLNKVVFQANRLTIHCLSFLKLYLLQKLDVSGEMPEVTEGLVSNIFKVLAEESYRDNQGEEPKNKHNMNPATVELKNELLKFHRDHYKPTMRSSEAELKTTNMKTILTYLARDIVTSYETNVSQHFVEYVELFVNVLYNKKAVESKLTQKEDKKKFRAWLREVKAYILERGEWDESKFPVLEDHLIEALGLGNNLAALLEDHYQRIIPARPPLEETADGDEASEKDNPEQNVHYEVKSNPQRFLPSMVYMMRFVEDCSTEGNEIAMYNVFPQRSETTPKYIRIDTQSVILLLVANNKAAIETLGTSRSLESDIKNSQAGIWAYFFNTNDKSFKAFKNAGYNFHHMIETDGVACSILFSRKGKKEAGVSKQYQYITDVDPSVFSNKTLVGIDPNKGNLIHASTIIPSAASNKQTEQHPSDASMEPNPEPQEQDGEQQIHFRYTQNQRRKESKLKRYKEIRKQQPIEASIDGNKLSVQQCWDRLSKFNKKSLNIKKYKEYLVEKNKINAELLPKFEAKIFRKLRWNAVINRRRSEDLMVQRFKDKFGTPDAVVIGFGDWEQRKGMSFGKEPTKGKGMRDIFKRAGYQVYLVQEYRTSCRCFKCGRKGDIGVNEKFLTRQDPRPWKEGEHILVHGLLRCKTCSCLWQRDVNSSLNIHRIIVRRAEGKERPQYLKWGDGSGD